MASLNTLWAEAIIEELTRAGARHAVVCPGSRSTPLALACARSVGLKTWSVVDERTAAFFALGIALESGRPAILLATSGTAGAHFLPAVMEASASGVPLFILTADRPWELHGFGAAQTMPQENLYGVFARAFSGLSPPEASSTALVHLRAVVCQTAAAACAAPRGPVQLNVPFREPLAPSPGDVTPPGLSELALKGRAPAPFLRFAGPDETSLAPAAELAQVSARLRQVERGIIVCGPRAAADGFGAAVNSLSRATGYPVFAEAASQARWGPETDGVISQYDLLLRDADFALAHLPELILRFGGGLTSKRLSEWMEESAAPVILLSDGGAAADPLHRAEVMLRGNASANARALSGLGLRQVGAWHGAFVKRQAVATQLLKSVFESQPHLTEPLIAFETVRALPRGAQLFLASSMPVRDVDAFAPACPQELRVFSNRGVNGIDGTLSSALGASVAAGRPTVLLTGDLAFLHDLNGLLIAKRYRLPLTIVVVNNDGGGIFSFLPVAQLGAPFEELFATPHGLNLKHAAALFEARYLSPSSPKALGDALHQCVGEGLSILDVHVDRHANPVEHQALYAQLAQAFAKEH